MKNLSFAVSILVGVMSLSSVEVLAVDQQRDQDRIQTQDRDQIYGSQLMTQQERADYRGRMRAAKTEQERNQIRNEHHERMKARAKARGKSLPDDPPTKGKGMGPGSGGMGPGGGGMRPGGGRGR
jgi:hypothetical protein